MQDPFLQVLPHSAALPQAVRDLHSRPGRFSGRCTIVRGNGALVALGLWAGRFPKSASNRPVSLTTKREATRWAWHRNFDGHQTHSNLSFDPGGGLVREDIGGLSIWMRPQVSEGKLNLEIMRISLFGCPCPRALRPRSTTSEWQDDQGRYRFDISADMPGVGLLIRYHGWLTRDHVVGQGT